ncbi:MAG: hypothetical protein AAB436_03460 [Patescibacteria group bacterium]
MSIEINGTPAEVLAKSTDFVSSRRAELAMPWADIALSNANARIEDTNLYIAVLALDAVPSPVSGEVPRLPESIKEAYAVQAKLAAQREQAVAQRQQIEFEANERKAVLDLIGANRGDVGYPPRRAES